MTAIEKLREIQNEEVNNGFANGGLWNDLEDLIYGLENPSSKLETVQSDMYESNINVQATACQPSTCLLSAGGL